MKTVNNFDTSKTGTDIELTIERDEDLGRINFEENFERLDTPYGRGSYYFFTALEHESPNYLSDCFDLSDCKRRDFRAYCIETESTTKKETIQEKFYFHVSWKDYAIHLLDEQGIHNAMQDGFPTIKGAKVLYEAVTASGCSQGDWAEILYKAEDWLKNPSEHFSNLIYNQRLYACLTVDGEEYPLEEAFKDSYEYEKEELLTYVKGLELDHHVLEFVTAQAPDYV